MHTDTDQCYMHLVYVGNTDVVSAEMSKVHSLVSYYPYSYSMAEQHYFW